MTDPVQLAMDRLRRTLRELRAALHRSESERLYYMKAYQQAREQTHNNVYCRRCRVIPVNMPDNAGLTCWKCGATGDALASWADLDARLRAREES